MNQSRFLHSRVIISFNQYFNFDHSKKNHLLAMHYFSVLNATGKNEINFYEDIILCQVDILLHMNKLFLINAFFASQGVNWF